MAQPAMRFVLKRLNWTEYYDGTLERQPGTRDVASFDTFDAADAERARREYACRAVVNPFNCGAGVHFWTHLDDIMRTELAGIGLWVDNANQTVAETVDTILRHQDQAKVSG